MPHRSVLVYGAGGHGKVIIDLLEQIANHEVIGVLDDEPKLTGTTFLGYPVLGGMAWLEERHPDVGLVIAIGDNAIRRRLAERLQPLQLDSVTAIHPSAQLGRDISIGEGTVVMAGAVVNSGAILGRHSIVNTGATIDHDCLIGHYAHICPGVHLSGQVRVDDGALVGVGASVIPNITIGEGATVGAGAAVTKDIPPRATAVGVPARIIAWDASGDTSSVS